MGEPYWRGAGEDEAMQEEHGFLWRVAVDSNLPDAERDALIASLAPVDVETLIAAASERPPGW